MKYEIGDEIVVLHTNEEGKVVEILNEKMVMIEVRGVKFPAYTDQIDFPYFKRFTEKKAIFNLLKAKVFAENIPKEKAKPQQKKGPAGVHLSLIPVFTTDEFGDEAVELFKLYLVNGTEKGYNFFYQYQQKEGVNFELESVIYSHHDFYLHDIPFADFNDNPVLYFEVSLINPEKGKAEYFELPLKVKGKQIFQKVEQMKQNNQPSILFELFKDYPDRESVSYASPSVLSTPVSKPKKEQKASIPARSVVDLHMEKLADNWQNMSNFEILTMQLNEFEKWYDLAVANHLQSMIVIHGVGSGKLKDEIHQILKSRSEVRYFINQYDHRFGYGATEIFFN